jgi:hypothetical protein
MRKTFFFFRFFSFQDTKHNFYIIGKKKIHQIVNFFLEKLNEKNEVIFLGIFQMTNYFLIKQKKTKFL